MWKKMEIDAFQMQHNQNKRSNALLALDKTHARYVFDKQLGVNEIEKTRKISWCVECLTIVSDILSMALHKCIHKIDKNANMNDC